MKTLLHSTNRLRVSFVRNFKLKELTKHIIIMSIPCPQKCGSKVMANNIEAHISKRCPLTVVTCQHCKDFQAPRNELNKHEKLCHSQSVPSLIHRPLEATKLAPCPNRCGAEMKPKKIEAHMRNYCPLTVDSCKYCKDFQAPRKKLNKHEKLCAKLALCPNGCGVRIKPENVDAHVRKHCLITCQYCKHFQARRKELKKHEMSCPASVEPCPNGCGKRVHASKMKDHIDKVCSLTPISCEFAYAGCTVVKHRRDMKQHIKEAKGEHLILTRDKVWSLEEEIAKLTLDNEHLVELCSHANMENERIKSENEKMHGDRETLEKENEKLKSGNDKMHRDIEKLEKENDKLQSNIAAKDEAITQLRKKSESDISAQILVSNLPPRTTKESLSRIFSRFGRVKNIRLFFRDDVAFIDFEDSTSRSLALDHHFKSGISLRGTLFKIS